MCLAQGHNAVTPVRLESAAPLSRVKHSTTEPLRSLRKKVSVRKLTGIFYSALVSINLQEKYWPKAFRKKVTVRYTYFGGNFQLFYSALMSIN